MRRTGLSNLEMHDWVPIERKQNETPLRDRLGRLNHRRDVWSTEICFWGPRWPRGEGILSSSSSSISSVSLKAFKFHLHHYHISRGGWRRWVRAWIGATFWLFYIKIMIMSLIMIMMRMRLMRILIKIITMMIVWRWCRCGTTMMLICSGLMIMIMIRMMTDDDNNHNKQGDVHVGWPWCSYALAWQVGEVAIEIIMTFMAMEMMITKMTLTFFLLQFFWWRKKFCHPAISPLTKTQANLGWAEDRVQGERSYQLVIFFSWSYQSDHLIMHKVDDCIFSIWPADHIQALFRDSGVPSDMEANFPSASIKFSNIRIGDIGSTFPGGVIVIILHPQKIKWQTDQVTRPHLPRGQQAIQRSRQIPERPPTDQDPPIPLKWHHSWRHNHVHQNVHDLSFTVIYSYNDAQDPNTCPGGSLADCIAMCPPNPPEIFQVQLSLSSTLSLSLSPW